MINTLLSKMNVNLESLTKVDQEVYKVLNKNVHELRNATVTEFAVAHHLSQASITRFCKKIGFNGFNDFKLALYHYQKEGIINGTTENDNIFQMYAQLILKMDEVIHEKDVEEVAKKIAHANKIIIAGANKSFLPAKLLQLNLMRISIMATVVTYDEWNMIADCLTPDDCLIIFSAKGKYKTLLDELTKIEKTYKILITMSEKGSMKNKTDASIYLPSSKNQNLNAYLENSIIFSVFADYLSSHIAKYAQ